MLQYPWKPHETLQLLRWPNIGVIDTGESVLTQEEADELSKKVARFYIDYALIPQINDVIHLAIQNTLSGTVNTETRALATARIPSAVDSNDTLRFLIAFLYEKQIGFDDFHRYFVGGTTPGPGAFDVIRAWNDRAAKIVEIMKDASDKVGSALAQNADFIRTAALIDLGEKTGLQLTSKANAISFNIGETSDQGNTISRTLAANTSFFMEKASDFRIAGTRANNTDTLVLTSKNGPNEITVTTNRVPVKSVLAKDASKTLVDAELMGSVVSTQPIEIPTSTRELPDITDLEVAEVQSVNIQDLFNGIRVNVTAVSSDISKVTVAVNENTTSMGVTGVAIGTSTITVTGTNEAGNVTVDFNVTIIAASD